MNSSLKPPLEELFRGKEILHSSKYFSCYKVFLKLACLKDMDWAWDFT